MKTFRSHLNMRVLPALAAAFLVNAAALNAADEPWATPATQSSGRTYAAPRASDSTGNYSYGDAYAQARTQQRPAAPFAFEPYDQKKWSLELGLGVWASSLTLVGGDVNVFYQISENQRLKFGVGVLSDVNPDELSNSRYSYGPTGSNIITGTGHLEVNHLLCPITVGWQYEGNLGETGRWNWHLGGEIGIGILNGSVDLSQPVGNWKNKQASDTAAILLVGVSAGIKWSFYKTDKIDIYTDLSVTGYVTSEAKFEYTNVRLPNQNVRNFEEKGSISGAKFAWTIGVKF